MVGTPLGFDRDSIRKNDEAKFKTTLEKKMISCTLPWVSSPHLQSEGANDFFVRRSLRKSTRGLRSIRGSFRRLLLSLTRPLHYCSLKKGPKCNRKDQKLQIRKRRQPLANNESHHCSENKKYLMIKNGFRFFALYLLLYPREFQIFVKIWFVKRKI